MSRSNAAAIRRRTQDQDTTKSTPPPVPQTPITQQRVLSTQEVILSLNNRIGVLEEKLSNTTNDNRDINNNEYINQDQLNNIINDLNHKFNTLADEMDDIKNIVIKLQSYTMDVNKTLIEERVKMLSTISTENLNITEETVKIEPDSINNSHNNSDQEN